MFIILIINRERKCFIPIIGSDMKISFNFLKKIHEKKINFSIINLIINVLMSSFNSEIVSKPYAAWTTMI